MALCKYVLKRTKKKKTFSGLPFLLFSISLIGKLKLHRKVVGITVICVIIIHLFIFVNELAIIIDFSTENPKSRSCEPKLFRFRLSGFPRTF